jgi:DNA-binding response OmpR family regulator
VTKLLLVEDERELGSVLTRHLEGEGFEVRVVTDGREALQRMAREVFDLVVLDVMLPSVNGLEVARILRSTPSGSPGTRSSVPILMLTARAEESDRVLGLEVGADDYLTKPFSLKELVARVRAMLRRVQLLRETLEFSREPVRIGAIQIDPEARSVHVEGQMTDLTPREYELLLMLARQPGRTFSRDYLLEHIWGTAYEGSDRVVDTTVVRLRRKLSLEGERVVSVWGVGYRLES